VLKTRARRAFLLGKQQVLKAGTGSGRKKTAEAVGSALGGNTSWG
jgi:hypothetical protein